MRPPPCATMPGTTCRATRIWLIWLTAMIFPAFLRGLGIHRHADAGVEQNRSMPPSVATTSSTSALISASEPTSVRRNRTAPSMAGPSARSAATIRAPSAAKRAGESQTDAARRPGDDDGLVLQIDGFVLSSVRRMSRRRARSRTAASGILRAGA